MTSNTSEALKNAAGTYNVSIRRYPEEGLDLYHEFCSHFCVSAILYDFEDAISIAAIRGFEFGHDQDDQDGCYPVA
jgi:hypothetical protein